MSDVGRPEFDGRLKALFKEAVESFGRAETERLFASVAKPKRKSRKKYDRLDELLLLLYYWGSWNGKRFIENKSLLIRFVGDGNLQEFLKADNVNGSDGLKDTYEHDAIEKRIDRLLERIPEAEFPTIDGKLRVLDAQHGKYRRGKHRSDR